MYLDHRVTVKIARVLNMIDMSALLLDANGNVTALKKGSCTIAVKTSNGKLAKVKIKVS